MSNNLTNELISNITLKTVEQEDLKMLGTITDTSIVEGAKILSMLLNNTTNINISNIEEFSSASEIFEKVSSGVSVFVSCELGIEGCTLYLFDVNDSMIIADAIMGAKLDLSKREKEISELQLNVLIETYAQFVSKIADSLTSQLDTKVGTIPPTVQTFTPDKPFDSALLGNGDYILITYDFSLTEEHTSTIYQVLPKLYLNSLIETYRIATNSANKLSVDLDGDSELDITDTTEKEDKDDVPEDLSLLENDQVTVQPVSFSSFDNAPIISNNQTDKNLNLLMDIKLKLTVELGRTELPIKKVLELARGSIIELDKVAGEPVELYANGKLIANGEVVVIEDNFGLRITSILSPDNRLKNL